LSPARPDATPRITVSTIDGTVQEGRVAMLVGQRDRARHDVRIDVGVAHQHARAIGKVSKFTSRSIKRPNWMAGLRVWNS
jgi:hypothetical protein